MLRKATGNYRQVGGVAMIDGMNSTAKIPGTRRKRGEWAIAPVLAGLAICICWIVSGRSRGADAPTTPFYYASATALDAQIVTLVVGINDSVGQAVVSSDRKYVTLNMDTSLMDSAGIRGFSYKRSGLGFVGSAAMPAPAGGRNDSTPSIAASAGQIAPAVSPLDKPGMVLIAQVER